MKRLLVFCLLLATFILAISLLAQAPAVAPVAVKMAFQMPSSAFPFRDAHLIAYPAVGSDLEIPLRCAYLADLDTYVWQFSAKLPAAYMDTDWVVEGYAHGLVAAMKFRPQNGAMLTLTPIVWIAPIAAPRVAGQPLTIDFLQPALDPAVVLRWEVLQDGKPLPLDAQGNGVGGVLDQVRTTGLRCVLIGGPKVHALSGPQLEITPDLGDQL